MAVPGVVWPVLVGAVVREGARKGLRWVVRREEGARAVRRGEACRADRAGGEPDRGDRAHPEAAPAVCSRGEACEVRSGHREDEGAGRRGERSVRSGLSSGDDRLREGAHRDVWGEVRPEPGGVRKAHPEPGEARKARPGEDRGGGRELPAEARSERGGGVPVAHRPEEGRVVRHPRRVFVGGPPWEAGPRGGGDPHRAGPGRHRGVVLQGCDEAGSCAY